MTRDVFPQHDASHKRVWGGAASREKWPGRHRLILVGLIVIVLAVIVVVVASMFTVRPDFGPLAVVGYDTGDEAITTGSLHITDKCVFLQDARGEPWTLVWAQERTEWRADGREVVHRSREGKEATLRDGEVVTVSGGGDSAAEGGMPGDQWVAKTVWILRPDMSCPTASRWFVNDVIATAIP